MNGNPHKYDHWNEKSDYVTQYPTLGLLDLQCGFVDSEHAHSILAYNKQMIRNWFDF